MYQFLLTQPNLIKKVTIRITLETSILISKNLKNLGLATYTYLPIQTFIRFKTKNKIYMDKFSKQLCGKFRKGHFQGCCKCCKSFFRSY